MANPPPGRHGTTHLYVIRPKTDDEVPWEEFLEKSPMDIELTPELMDLWIKMAIAMWKLPPKENKDKGVA